MEFLSSKKKVFLSLHNPDLEWILLGNEQLRVKSPQNNETEAFNYLTFNCEFKTKPINLNMSVSNESISFPHGKF